MKQGPNLFPLRLRLTETNSFQLEPNRTLISSSGYTPEQLHLAVDLAPADTGNLLATIKQQQEEDNNQTFF